MKKHLLILGIGIVLILGLFILQENKSRILALIGTNPMAPYAPYNLKADVTNYNQINISWTDNSSNVATSVGVNEFQISRRLIYTGPWKIIGIVEYGALAYTDYNLAPGSYDYRVNACNDYGCSEDSGSNIMTLSLAADTTLPAKIESFSIPKSEVTDTQINLYWSASTDDIGLSHYNIYRSISSALNFSLIASVSASTLAYTDKNLSPVTHYHYYIKAKDWAGNESSESVIIDAITLTLSTAGSYIRVTSPNGGECYTLPSNLPIRWTGSNVNVAAVYYGARSGTPIFINNGTVFDWYMTASVSPTTGGSVWVVAVDDKGVEGLADTNDKPFTISLDCNKEPIASTSIPAIPTYLKAGFANDGASILLNWQDNSQNENEFRIYRRALPDGKWSTVSSVGSGTTSFTDRSVPPGDYEYDVSACNVSGCSDYSNLYRITALATLPAAGKIYSTAELKQGDMISASGSDDPDVYIINELGYKRLFLNPAIFGFYGHLGGFQNVKTVASSTRDNYKTSGLFRNCETDLAGQTDGKVYGVEVTGGDTGLLHWINVSGQQAVAEDPDFFSKIFCINNSEFNWYSKGPDYSSLGQVNDY